MSTAVRVEPCECGKHMKTLGSPRCRWCTSRLRMGTRREEFVASGRLGGRTRRLVLVLALVLCAVAVVAAAESPKPCEQSVECQSLRATDLKDHRDWLETQVAYLKTLLREANAVIVKQAAELQNLRRLSPPAPSPLVP